jgi:hypothetical protein
MVQGIGAALAIAGPIVKGLGANAAYKANARAADEAAVMELNDGAAEEARIRDAARLAMGRQIAGQAESGFVLGAGSAYDALLESQINASIDALNIRREAAGRSRAMRAKADQERRAGTNALISAGFDAVGSALAMKGDWAAAKSGMLPGGGSLGGGSTSYADPDAPISYVPKSKRQPWANY